MEEPEHTIFAADNDESDQELLINAFKAANKPFKIIFSKDGEKLLRDLEDFYAKNQAFPRMILLDLNMTDPDGLETLSTIKSHFLYKAIPVLVLSSKASDEVIIKAYTRGANSFIVKPATAKGFEDFVSTLNRYWFEFASLPKKIV